MDLNFTAEELEFRRDIRRGNSCGFESHPIYWGSQPDAGTANAGDRVP